MFKTTLIASDGYSLSAVSVVMGTTDITSSTYNSDTGEVSIQSVEGDVVITATA